MSHTATDFSLNEVRLRLRETFQWRGANRVADVSEWWSDAAILPMLGSALAGLHDADFTLVLAPEAVGFILGPLVAQAGGAGFLEMRKDLTEEVLGDQVLLRSTPPDYLGRTIEWGIRRRRLRPGQRVLFVDDWIDTAATAETARRLVDDSGATWVGAAVLVDSASSSKRRELNLRAILRERELG